MLDFPLLPKGETDPKMHGYLLSANEHEEPHKLSGSKSNVK